MPYPAAVRYLLLPLSLLLSSAYAAEAHWSYKGKQGSSHWGELGHASCSNGKMQSPVDLDLRHITPKKTSPTDLDITYGRSALKVVNNGHTIQANTSGSNELNYKGTDYRLLQFHFHTPSEHLFNHRHYPMEMHLVNRDKDGRLLVLGVMIEEGEENTELARLWETMPNKEGQMVTLDAATAPDLSKLQPSGNHHLFYSGSLTTPPCSESVQWALFEQPIELSAAQIKRFQRLFPDNHRPDQPLNGREVSKD